VRHIEDIGLPAVLKGTEVGTIAAVIALICAGLAALFGCLSTVVTDPGWRTFLQVLAIVFSLGFALAGGISIDASSAAGRCMWRTDPDGSRVYHCDL
jgi:hypothetical protein